MALVKMINVIRKTRHTPKVARDDNPIRVHITKLPIRVSRFPRSRSLSAVQFKVVPSPFLLLSASTAHFRVFS